MFILLPQWGLYLEGEDVNRDFEQLLEHRCPYCHEEADTFPTFKDLKRHVQRDHEMYSCDLCSDNIKVEKNIKIASDWPNNKLIN